MPMEPATIAALLREIAIYFELDGDRHRAFAYDRAARSRSRPRTGCTG